MRSLAITSRTLLVLAVSLFSLQGALSAYFYYEDFTANSGEWTNLVTPANQFRYGREGVIVPPTADYDRLDVDIASGNLLIDMKPIGSGQDDGPWTGICVKNILHSFSASAYMPFGAKIDVIHREDGGGYTVKSKDQLAYAMWFAVENGITGTTTGELIDDYYAIGGNMGPQTTGVYEQFGRIYGVFQGFDLTTAERPDGTIIDISGIADFDYDASDVNDLANNADNYFISYMMTHNGDSVKFYINPDPDDNNVAYPNEYLLVDERAVTWDSDIRIMLGAETRATLMEVVVRYDDLLVKSPADSSVPDINPNTEVYSTNSTDVKTFTIDMGNQVNSTNSGFNVFTITKPSVFGSWDTNALYIRSDWDNDGTLETNVIRPVSDLAVITVGQCAVQIVGDALWVRLGTQIGNATANQDVLVTFDMATGISNAGQFTFNTTIEGVLFDPDLGQIDYSTTGPMKGSGTLNTVNIIAIPGPVQTFASITPNEIFLGPTFFTFTYFLKGDTNVNNQDPILDAAIEIPAPFASCAVSNVNSVLMGTNEPSYVTIETISGLSTNRVIHLNYSDYPITPGGLDVVSFEVYGSPELGTNIPWNSWVDGAGVGSNSMLSKTNDIYPNYSLTIYPQPTDAPWDFQVITSRNYAPVAMGISNIIAMSYFDIIEDNEGIEILTNVEMVLSGDYGDLIGDLILYRDDGDGFFSTGSDTEVDTVNFTSLSTYMDFNISENVPSDDPLNPTRYWVALQITNIDAGIFTNNINILVTNVRGSGPQLGNIDRIEYLTNSLTDARTRIDTMHVFFNSSIHISNTVKQGSFNNLYLQFTISNDDPDATNYLSGITLSNKGTGDNSDFGVLSIFRDNGDGVFDIYTDSVIMADPDSLSGKVYNASVSPPVPLTGTADIVFWASFNVELIGGIKDTLDLEFSAVSDIVFADQFNDHSDPRPEIIPLAPLPLPPTTYPAAIIPAASRPYDFYLDTVNYSYMPQAFTSDEYVPVGFVDMIMDVEDTNAQAFTAMDISLTSSGIKTDINGIAYLYKEDTGIGFDAGDDILIASNFVTGGNDFTISLSNSDITTDQFNPDRFYLVFYLTNDINTAMDNKIAFQITSLSCIGPNGGIFTNQSQLSAASAEARVDNGEVVINSISNYITNYYPKQGSFNNPYLSISMQGVDADATNFLSYIDIVTNGLSSVAISHIASVKLYEDDGDGVYNKANDPARAVATLDANGYARLELSIPIALAGTTEKVFFAGYDLASEDDSVVGRYFGIKITNNSVGFVDNIPDGFAQVTIPTGTLTGPATDTNVTISSLYARSWDFKLIKSENLAPVSIGTGSSYVMSYFDIVSDGENPNLEKITNIAIDIGGSSADVYGFIAVYRESDGTFDILSNATDTLISNVAIVNPASLVQINEIQSNISTDPLSPTRYWVALQITNTSAAVYDDLVSATTARVLCDGPNNGKTNEYYILTNISTTTSRVDNYEVFIDGLVLLSNNVAQGSFNNPYLRLTMTNFDLDAMYYLSSIQISNRMNADAADLGSFQFYLDNGNGVFDGSPQDTIVGVGDIDASSVYTVGFNPSLTITNYNILWGVFNVDFSADTSHYMAFQITDAANDIVFSDEYDDAYSLLPNINAASPLPPAITTNRIIPFTSQPYDYFLKNYSYNTLPHSFTTNELVTVGWFEIFMDTEDTNAQVFKGMQVDLQTTGIKDNITGTAYLYKEVANEGFSAGDDLLIGTAAVTGGADFTITSDFTNFSFSGAAPDTVYLVYRHTAPIITSMTDTVAFQVTNMLCTGPNGGVFTNTSVLTNFASAEVRVDNGEVAVSAIDNAIVSPYPKQGSFNNPYLKIILANVDIDTTNYLSYVDIVTNINTTASNEHIAAVKLYLDNGDGTFASADDAVRSVSVLDTGSGTSRLQASIPIVLSGTNEVVLFIGYDLSSDDASVVGKKFGLAITNGSFGFVDEIDDDFVQTAFATGTLSGPSTVSNVEISSLLARAWDFKVIRATNVAPVSISVSNRFVMSYFDMVADGEIPGLETITNIRLQIGGTAPDVIGTASLYRESDGTFTLLSNSDTLLSDFTGAVAGSILSYNGTVTGLSTDPLNPTRFWVTLEITNADKAVFSNAVNMTVDGAVVTGPDGGIIQDAGKLASMGNAVSLVDNYAVFVSGTTFLSNTVKQGSFNNLFCRLVLTNYDLDSTNYLSSILVTNLADADNLDLGAFQFYLDDGNGTFEVVGDTVVGVGSMTADRSYNVIFNPRIAVTNYNILWGVFNVNFGAVVGNEIAFRVQDPANDIVFVDEYLDDYTLLPAVIGSSMPTGITTNGIIPFTSQPYDFSVKSVNYNSLPEAFTASQLVPVGEVEIFMDTENTNTQVFKGVEVDLSTSGVNNNITGIAYLYKEITGEGFAAGDDLLIGSNFVTGGADFTIPADYTNITYEGAEPDTVYLVFKLTNDINSALDDTVIFQITNLLCDGPNGGIFNNTEILTNSISAEIRADSGEVDIVSIENNITSPYPKQGSFNNPYIKITLAGVDEDATNYLSYVDVVTNINTTASNEHIASVKFYLDNGDGTFNSADEDIRAVSVLNIGSGTARLQTSIPVMLAGTNEVVVFIGYDLSSDDASVVGKKFGLAITNGSFGFVDDIDDDFTLDSFASGVTSGPSPVSNVEISSLLARAWDFMVMSSKNISPVSIGLSNAFVMSYFDIVADGEIPGLEKLTNIQLAIGGVSPDVYGAVAIWRDTDGTDSILSNTDTRLSNFTFAGPAVNMVYSGIETNLSIDQLNPTRYWITLEVTNANTAVFTNNVNVKVSGAVVVGPDGGQISQYAKLTNMSAGVSRVDNYLLYISGTTQLSNTIMQGSFNNLYCKLVVTNYDLDSTNYLSSIRITNTASADTADLGAFQFYLDNGDGNFSTINDTVVGVGSMDATGVYDVIFNPKVDITNYNILWGVFNVDFGAVVGNEVAFRIIDPAGDLGFSDEYDDGYILLPEVIGSSVPGGITTNKIIPFTSQPYDFSVKSASYSSIPEAFTSGQLVPVGSVEIFMDTEDTNAQVFKGMEVNLSTSGVNSGISGIAYLYKEITGEGFALADDLLIGSNFVTGGADFTIPADYTNITYEGAEPDTIYLVFQLTNNINSALDNTVTFQVTNLLCDGPNGGIFNNTEILTNFISAEVRADSGEVLVRYITNLIPNPFPKQGSFNNPYLKISMSGIDGDATNFFSYVDVRTNGKSTVSNTHIAAVKLYRDNGDGAFTNADESIIAVGILDTNGYVRLQASFPVELSGSNEQVFFVGYDLSSEDDSVVGRYFGLTVGGGSFGFVDGINDNFTQSSFSTGNDTGPASESNVTISSLSAKIWDFKVIASENLAPVSISMNTQYVMGYFDIIADGENPNLEILTNITLSMTGLSPDVVADASIYRESGADFDNFSAGDVLLTNFSGITASSSLAFSGTETNFSVDPLAPTRFWILLDVTGGAPAVFSNTVGLVVSDVRVSGPDAGAVNQAWVLTNVPANVSLIDNYEVFVDATVLLSNTVKQGAFNSLYMQLVITNYDLDATNYLSKIYLSNLASAGESDLGAFQFYLDDGDSNFVATNDTVVGVGDINASGVFEVIFNPKVQFNQHAMLWGAFNVDFGAAVGSEVAIRITDPAVDIIFSDELADDYTLLPTVTASPSLPMAITTNAVIPFTSQPYDFSVKSVSYNLSPESITTNQYAVIGEFDIFMDTEEPVNQFLTGVQVRLSSASTLADIGGIACFYREVTGSGFSDADDSLLGSNVVIGGGDFTITFNEGGISDDINTPDKFYLVFILTNDINQAMSDTVSFQVTNFLCTGPSGNVFTNTSLLTSFSSREIRADSGEVMIQAINNWIPNYTPPQASFDQLYLRIQMQNADDDATNFLSYIEVTTNDLTTVLLAAGHITKIKIFDQGTNFIRATVVTNNIIRIDLPSAIPIYGTSPTNLIIGYDVSGSSAVVGRTFGMAMVGNPFGFVDGIDDGFPQSAFATGTLTGPAVKTNVVFKSFNVKEWDMFVVDAKNVAPESIGVSNTYGMVYFDIINDENESPVAQRLTNIYVAVDTTNENIGGEILLYRDDVGSADFPGVGLVTSTMFAGSGTNQLSMIENNLSGNITSPTRYWLALRLTNAGEGVFSNYARFRVPRLVGNGPDDPTNGYITNQIIFDDMTSNSSRVDNYRITVFGEFIATNTNIVKPSSGRNETLKLTFVNEDPDGVMWLDRLRVTNSGNADAGDIDFFLVYRDDNQDDIFDDAFDSLSLKADVIADSVFDAGLVGVDPIALDRRTNVFFCMFNVKFSPTVSNTIELNIAQASDVFLTNAYNDIYTRPINMTVDLPIPTNYQTQYIVPRDNNPTPYDFFIREVTYSAAPDTMSTNQLIVMGDFTIYRDGASGAPEVLTNIGINLDSTGTLSGVSGLAYLYKEVSNEYTFSPVDDSLVASNFVSGGNDFYFDLAISNITTISFPGDKFYLAMLITNDISLVNADTFSFQITNLLVSGQDSIATGSNQTYGLEKLTNSDTGEIRVDDYRLNIDQIISLASSNFEPFPIQGSSRNVFLEILISGNDPDAENYLDFIDIMTNMSNNIILVSNGITGLDAWLDADQNGVFQDTLDVNLDNEGFFSSGEARFIFNTIRPAVMGTNSVRIFITYNVNLNDFFIGQRIGLMVTNIGFYDNYFDDYDQTPYTLDLVQGPFDGVTVPVKDEDAEPWDVKVVKTEWVAPANAVYNTEYSMLTFNIRQEQNPPLEEYLTGIRISNYFTNNTFSGILRVYTNSDEEAALNASEQIGSDYIISNMDQLFTMSFPSNTVSDDPDNPTVFHITFEPDTYDNAAIFGFDIIGLYGGGDNTLPGSSNVVVEDFNLFKNLSTGNIQLEENRVSVVFSNMMPEMVTQGWKTNVVAMITLDTADVDAAYPLDSLVFDLSGSSLAANLGDEIIGKLYRDNGDGSYSHVSDTLVDAGRLFSGNQFTASAGSTLITNGGVNFFLVLEIKNSAPALEKFAVTMSLAANSNANIFGSSAVPVYIIDISPDTTTETEIQQLIVLDCNKVVADNTIINTCQNTVCTVFMPSCLDDVVDFSESYSAYVYDIFGDQIKELEFDIDKVIWDGTDESDTDFVPSGMYKIKIIAKKDSDDEFEVGKQHIKVMIIQCE